MTHLMTQLMTHLMTQLSGSCQLIPEPAKRLGCNGRRRSGLARVADLAVAAL
jgi:hypothetical protein